MKQLCLIVLFAFSLHAPALAKEPKVDEKYVAELTQECYAGKKRSCSRAVFELWADPVAQVKLFDQVCSDKSLGLYCEKHPDDPKWQTARGSAFQGALVRRDPMSSSMPVKTADGPIFLYFGEKPVPPVDMATVQKIFEEDSARKPSSKPKAGH